MNTDTIAVFLTQIRNATKARHQKVDVSPSKMRVAIAEIMRTSGLIQDYKLYRKDDKGVLRLYLKYRSKGDPFIHGLRRVSKQSLRVYSPAAKLPVIMGGIGISIISTSKGVMTDQMARENKLGGEVLCQIW